MLLDDLRAVLSVCPRTLTTDQYRHEIVERNVAAKGTLSSRERTFRYLRELYALDVDNDVFRALLRLWDRDPDSQPLLALLSALHRDRTFRATVSAVVPREVADPVTSTDLAEAVAEAFPGAYAVTIRAKVGRNALSSWQQAGYLVRIGRSSVIRSNVRPGSGAVAMALVLGSLEGRSGERLFESEQIAVFGASGTLLHDRAHDCARRGWIEYRSRGAVTEVDLSALTAPVEDARLPLEMGGEPA